MEFIITGLFIIFFSYILLYSLYNFLFKRSTVEGLDKKATAKSEKSIQQVKKKKKIITRNLIMLRIYKKPKRVVQWRVMPTQK